MDDTFSVGDASKKRCFCSSCGPDGCLLPLSTFKSHQRVVELARQRIAAQNLSSGPSSSTNALSTIPSSGSFLSPVFPPNAPSPSASPSALTQNDEAAAFLEELRTTMSPTYLAGLEFLGDPVVDGPYVFNRSLGDVARLDDLYTLVPASPRNRLHRSRENRLRIIQQHVTSWEPSSSRDEVLQALKVAFDFMEVQKALAWSLERNSANTGIVCTDIYYQIHVPHRDEPFLSACFMTAMLLSTFGSLSQKDAKLLLTGFRTAAAKSVETQHLAHRIPGDIRDILSQFSAWDPIVDRYITCPSCFEHYPVVGNTSHNLPRCIHQDTPSSPACNTVLWALRGHSQHLSPVVISVFQNFKQWLGRQLARQIVEDACEEAFTSPPQDPMQRERDGTRLWRIKSTDGTTWLPGPPAELRLVFSWSTDGWNPYGNKLSGVSRTSTGFWLVNMGLPLDIRYLEENMFYFGAVPGKPNGSRLNPTLELLVSVFLEFWEPGVWYGRTSKCPAGRLVRAALVPQISDVMASRQAAGRGAVNLKRHFCLFCLLHRDQIECSDHSTFTPRDEDAQRELALQWKNATSEEERKILAKANDIRYTPMLRLPYHRATQDNIPEPLHLFYEYLIQVYIRHCLRVHYVVDGQELSEVIKETKHARPPPALMNVALEILRSAPGGVLSPAAEKKLETCTEDVLFHLCNDFGLRYAGFKRQLVLNLAEWRRTVTTDEIRLERLPGDAAAGIVSQDGGDLPAMAAQLGEPNEVPPSTSTGSQVGEDIVSQSETEASVSTLSRMDTELDGTQYLPGDEEHFRLNVDLGLPTSARPAWLQLLSLSEMRALCSSDAEKVRAALNRSRKARTIANHCNGNKTILVAFVKVLGLTDKVDVSNPRVGMSTIAQELKNYLITNSTAIHNVQPIVEAYLSTTTETASRAEALSLEPSSGIGVGASSHTVQDTGGTEEPWLAMLTPEEKQLMRSPQATAVSEHLMKGNAPSTIMAAARSDTALSTVLLQAYCKSLNLPTDGTGIVLAERLKAYTEELYTPAPPKITRLDITGPRREALTTSIMLRIKATMARTQMPSSADKAPSDWGTKGHGRVTGGQWLVIGTVHLPITLIPLWGHPSSPQHEKDLLNNLMTVVAVVCIGTLRVISLADTVDFDAAAQQYFEGKKRLFRDETIRPYDHLLLHWGDVLRWYGPTAAHDGSFFERHIRRLHSFNINMKSGELEETYMQSAGRHANLRGMFLDDHAISELSDVSELVEEFRRQTFADTRGTKLGSLLLESTAMRSVEGAKFLRKDVSEVTLSSNIVNLLLPTMSAAHSSMPRNASNIASALCVKAASFRGARYCPASEVECDSDMIYSTDGSTGNGHGGRLILDKIAAGRIVYMFLHGHSSTHPRASTPQRLPTSTATGSLWAVVRTYKPLAPDERHLDAHYRAFEFGGFCCKPEFEEGPPKLFNISRIVCQVAKVSMEFAGVSLLHFLPLARLTNALPRADSSVLPEVQDF